MTAICWPTYPESDTDLTWPDLTRSLLVIRSISQGFHLLFNVGMSYKISYQSRRLTEHYSNSMFPAGSYISSVTQDNVRLNDNSCFRIYCKSHLVLSSSKHSIGIVPCLVYSFLCYFLSLPESSSWDSRIVTKQWVLLIDIFVHITFSLNFSIIAFSIPSSQSVKYDKHINVVTVSSSCWGKHVTFSSAGNQLFCQCVTLFPSLQLKHSKVIWLKSVVSWLIFSTEIRIYNYLYHVSLTNVILFAFLVLWIQAVINETSIV